MTAGRNGRTSPSPRATSFPLTSQERFDTHTESGTRMHTHKHTHTETKAHIHALSPAARGPCCQASGAGGGDHTHTRTRTYAHTHTHAHTEVVMGSAYTALPTTQIHTKARTGEYGTP